jgi:hypothetical protein
MRVLAGLVLIVLLVLVGTPAGAETDEEKSETVAQVMVRVWLQVQLLPLTFDIGEFVSPAPSAPDGADGPDPVTGHGGKPLGSGNGGGGGGGGAGADAGA